MATVNAVLITNRKDKQGRCTIKLAVQHENKKKLFSLVGGTFKVTEDEWDNEQRLIKFSTTNTKQVNALNTEILLQKQNILEVIEQYEKSRTPWSFAMLADRLEKKPTTASFVDMAEKYINNVYKTRSPETARNYKWILNTFRTFCGERYDRLTCSDIDYNFILDYHKYLKTLKNGKGLENSTIRSRMVFIKCVLNMAIREKVASPETFPFSKKKNNAYYDLSKLKRSKTHRSLPESYLEQLLSYRAYDHHDLHWQIHVFKVAHPYLEFWPLMHLKHSDIKMYKDETGSKRNGFRVRSAQFKKDVTIFLTPLMMEIIADAKANYKCYGDYVFPILQKDEYDAREKKSMISLHRHNVDWL